MSDIRKDREKLRKVFKKKQINISDNEIAIIGVSGRYPGARTFEELWEIFSKGKNCITEIPADRWNFDKYYDPDPTKASEGKMYCKWGGFIDDVYAFDPLLFNISQKDCEMMDPQVRLLLEMTWSVLENAGYPPLQNSSQNIGVFMGVTTHTYNTLLFEERLKGNVVSPTANIAAITNRISHFFNFTGPSIPIDTECSSSLTAIHLACKSIKSGECPTALAGGVNLYLHPSKYINLCNIRTASKDEKTRSFGKGGTGFVPGEGAGMVLLKPLSKAVLDGDYIYGVIKGSAINNWGKSSMYMSPNPLPQSDVIFNALNDARIHPQTISYIEAQGMGSDIADVSELSSLTKAFRYFLDDNQFCPIGSLKPNIGHPEAAAGIVQLTKVLLQLKHKKIAPSLNSDELNPNIDFENSPFYVQHELRTWDRPKVIENDQTKQVPRRAGISSFGSGGTGAHIIIEEFENIIFAPKNQDDDRFIIVLSASSKVQLKESAKNLAHFMSQYSKDVPSLLQRAAYTLQTGRTAMKERLAVVVSQIDDLIDKLEKYCQGIPDIDHLYTGNIKTPGQIPKSSFEKDNLSEIARLWVSGKETDWLCLYPEGAFSRIPLPTYPFSKNICRVTGSDRSLDSTNSEDSNKADHQCENRVEKVYTFVAQDRSEAFNEEYLTFCPFEEKIPGFSMSRVFMNPEKYADELEFVKSKQVEMRHVLYCKENFDQITKVLDIGCGHGTDIIKLVKTYSHIYANGFTITKAQADLGNKRIADMNLSDRAEIFYKDSSKDPFPDMYDLIFGFEVCCHIHNKSDLFKNIASSLSEKKGRVLFIDFIANLKGGIVDTNLGISIATNDDWSLLLSEQNLIIRELIDVSPQIANFLHDPERDTYLKNIPKLMKDFFQNNTNNCIALEKGWLSYCLFKIEKENCMSRQEIMEYNTIRILNKTPYPTAREEMLNPKETASHKSEKITPTIQKVSKQTKIDRMETPDIKNKIVDILRTVLGFKPEEIENSESLNELGITSLNAVELLEAINTRFGLNMPTSVIFECNSLHSLTEHIYSIINQLDSLKKDDTKCIVACEDKNTAITSHSGRKSIQSTCKLKQDDTGIAIIGMSGRLPMAENIDQFWQNIVEGKNCITEIPKDRWDWKTFYGDPLKDANKTDCKWGGFINGIEEFDPFFFGISPKEAELMDPQQRLLMLKVWEAIEDAGINPKTLSQSATGVFISPGMNEYVHMVPILQNDPYAITGMALSAIPNRISYSLNLNGPSEYCETGCSSALVALHRAIASIRSGECEQAIIGAVNLLLSPSGFIFISTGYLSKTGEAKSFQEEANGFIRSEGVGAVIVKPLHKAIYDNNRIYAVVKGTGVMHGGKGISFTAPTTRGMKAAITEALLDSEINPQTISYIEAHGTATPVGDTVEIESLKSVYNEIPSENELTKSSLCYISSLKPCMGHAEIASGIAALIKVVMAINNKLIPGLPGFKNLNKNIVLKESRFQISPENTHWEAPTDEEGKTLPRRAAINSYGFGGVNAHVIIEEYMKEESIASVSTTPYTDKPYIILLSAKTEEQLKTYAINIEKFLHDQPDLANLAYTLQVGREPMQERLALIVNSVEELQDKLKCFIDNKENYIEAFFRGKTRGNKDKVNIFETDEDLKESIDAWIEKGKYSKLLSLWVNGLEIDWDKLYQAVKPQRISLPTYPFSRERYWIDPIDQQLDNNIETEDDHIPLQPETQLIISGSPSGKGRRKETRGFTVTECLEYDLKEKIGNLLKIPPSQLDSNISLAEFGFDSIALTNFASQLTQFYEVEIEPSVFFGNPTIEKLIEFFLTAHGHIVEEFYKESGPQKITSQTLAKPGIVSKSTIPDTPIMYSKNIQSTTEPIAIIGMSGKFPEAQTIDDMWQILVKGIDAVTEISTERLDLSKYDNEFDSTKFPKRGGILKGMNEFDPLFFEISPKEAEEMDPRQRLLLQESWKALEDAGYGPQHIKKNKIGTFVGVESSDYRMLSNIIHKSITSDHEGVLASRLAYFLNLNGPTMAINTACSSGLVAAHQACQSLRNKECDTALASGVHLMLSPEAYIVIQKTGMMSPSGKCSAFDKKADGMVPGEAVVSLVLKRLKDAERDNDSIYAVIKGNGVNYDGKSNGITAPNGNAQSALLKTVYDQFQINPEKIGYIVTHGTGTQLGDPVEINALYDAFKSYTDTTGYCALTSSKTNFGHTMAASGLVSLVNLIQAMRYKTIPSNLNCTEENDYIKWEDSPFYVNKSCKSWDIADGDRRIGAVSAFGMSGTNAHMVLESYENACNENSASDYFYLLTFSAKTSNSLEILIDNILEFLQRKNETTKDLKGISLTLSEGRHHFEYRNAVVVQDIDDAVHVLSQLKNKEKSPKIFNGKIPRDFTGQNAIRKYIGDMLIQAGNEKSDQNKYREILYGLAELYCQGYDIQLSQLYCTDKLSGIRLPTYPFEKEQYWLPESIQSHSISTSENQKRIHPLLHQNTSDFSQQRFHSIFTGNEFFLTDHIIQGKKILPGVAYLEMARTAVEHSANVAKNDTSVISLKNVIWARPIIIEDKPVSIHIKLLPEDNGEILYEIYSLNSQKDDTPFVHNQGTAILHTANETPVLDIALLKTKCNQKQLNSEECYKIFEQIGVTYGQGLKGIEHIFIGNDCTLAKLFLPPSVSKTNQYILHPCLFDSALQASIGMIIGSNKFGHEMPFALEHVDIFSKSTSSMWAFVKDSENSLIEDNVKKLDIDLCDEDGNVCVRIKGLTSRVPKTEVESMNRRLLFKPSWREDSIDSTPRINYESHIVVLCEPDDDLYTDIKNKMNDIEFIFLKSKDKDINKKYSKYALILFEKIQTILKSKPKEKVLFQVVVSKQHLFSGLSGLLKTARAENPMFVGQLIIIDEDQRIQTIIEENSRCPDVNHIKYKGDKRFVADLEEIGALSKKTVVPWKDNGIYLITGGAGGLGLYFAKEISKQVKNPVLILTGRSTLNEEKKKYLVESRSTGVTIEYRQVDVTQKQEVTALIEDIDKKFGSLNGIIHSAGIINDNFIIRKTKDEFKKVLAPKVEGLTNIDDASKALPLDFFVVFSSMAGLMGNIGQVDYACANAFMDAYASYRNDLVKKGKRNGRTLSINWSLWKDGGMRVDEDTEKMMIQNSGMAAMSSEIGVQFFYHCFSLNEPQIVVFSGHVERFRQFLMASKPKKEVLKNKKSAPNIEDSILTDKAENYFKGIFSSVIKLPVNKIEADAPMEKYGMDSIMVLQLTEKLEKPFGSLSKTLFFEYQNIRELVRYFLQNYRDELTEEIGIQESPKVQLDNDHNSQQNEKTLNFQIQSRFSSFRSEPHQELSDDIAIIGLSGRYPQADSIDEFWQILRDGIDCITEIPSERWDHSIYYDANKEAPGKTYAKWGGFLNDVDKFDPLFFNISPTEAETMEPQERLFLECVYETLEDAGYTRSNLRSGFDKKIGVYVGIMYEDYQLFAAQEQVRGNNVVVGGSPSSIANRVSYFCNFQGPSIALDTMCSSSLTALHLACRSLKNSETKLAIVGGVNVSIHPNKFLILGQGRFASSKGRCESFGKDGDGYVPGEGVGAILLKPLSDALSAGDHIYGIIKGSSVNHDGKTNGYTVPNPNAQSDVIKQAFKDANISPETISYLEAHGTGTSLGDPVEIAGLNNAFSEYTDSKQFCAIGSAKSNIGHCESAAGIAGITKVLLQFKHRKLFPSLHSQTLNPNIDFENTPFVVQQKLTEWKQLEINGKKIPRRAGISSFGAGGSNAHVILEEYVHIQNHSSQMDNNIETPVIFVLSAKNKEQLKHYAERMIKFLDSGSPDQSSTFSLTNMTYTLQVGREAMEERLGGVVNSVGQLMDSLKRFIEDPENLDGFYCGCINETKTSISSIFDNDEDISKIIDKWIAQQKYSKLADMWVKGLNIDWHKLYRGMYPKRISLPKYPFAKERYWIPKGFGETTNLTSSVHPLIDRFIPSLPGNGLTFKKTFSYNDLIIKNFKANELSMVPEAVYLEMIYAATAQINEINSFIITQLIWLAPASLQEEKKDLSIIIKQPLPDNNLEYEIQSLINNKPVVHLRGKSVYNAKVNKTVQRIDVNVIQKKCSNRVDQSTFYNKFEKSGLKYGNYFKAIKTVWSTDKEALCHYSLSGEFEYDSEDYTFHPVLMTCAFNVMAYLIGFERTPSISSIGTSEVNYPLKSNGYIYVQLVTNNRFNIAMLDETGLVRIKLYDAVLSELRDPFQQFFHKPLWKKMPLEKSNSQDKESNSKSNVLIIYPTEGEELQRTLTDAHTQDEVFKIKLGKQTIQSKPDIYEIKTDDPTALAGCVNQLNHIDKIYFLGGIQTKIHNMNDLEPVKQSQEKGLISLFRLIKSLISREIKNTIDIKIITANVCNALDKDSIIPYAAGISGFSRVTAREYPDKFRIICIDIQSQENISAVAKQILAEPCTKTGDTIAIREGNRFVRTIEPLSLPAVKSSPFKHNGVYLIAGGAGGIGLALGIYLAENYKARLILTGRKVESDLNIAQKNRISQIESKGGEILYLKADMTNYDHMAQVVKNGKSQFGHINGVIHAATVIKDKPLREMDEQNFCDALESKVYGSIVLYNALKKESLDFMLFFSSASGSFFGTPGQSNYGAANAFEDSFALFLAQKNEQLVKVVNWGYWGKTGFGTVASDEIYNQLIAQGIIPVSPEEGMESIKRILCSDISQVIAVKAKQNILKDMGAEIIIKEEKPTYLASETEKTQSVSSVPSNEGLRIKTDRYVKSVFAKILRLNESRIENHVTFGEYGINSILMVAITARFSKDFGKLPVTLFLENKTINELIDYFLFTHQERLVEFLGTEIGISEVQSLFSKSESFENEIHYEHSDPNKNEVNQNVNKSEKFVDFLTDNDVGRLLSSLEMEENHEKLDAPEKQSKAKSLVFMFPGLGDHYVNMGKGLYESEKIFREQIDICCEIAKPILDIDLKTVIYNTDKEHQKGDQPLFDLKKMMNRSDGSVNDSDNKLNQILYSHSAVFMTEYALARLWIDRNIKPDAMIGLSLGEYTAACIAGVMALEDALRMLIKRAQLIEKLPEGLMLATLLSEEELKPFLGDDLDIGVIGTPYSCMISGSIPAIKKLEEKLTEKELVFSRMQVNRAFHSKEMAPIGKDFIKFLKTVTLQPPEIPYISNVTGDWITNEQALNPEYWLHHICKTVRFADGISNLLKYSDRVFIEVGPGSGLCSFVFQHPDGEHLTDLSVFQSLPNRSDNQDDEDFLSNTWERIKSVRSI
jgi:acyl transferase domain-containing protein/acyl carrier protein/SAM-dependent methyltransferase